MGRVAIMADSNSGITQKEALELGIEILPMPVLINGKEYFEDVTITQDDFYAHMAAGDTITTSQPAPGSLMDRWKKLLEEYDEVVYIPMSSALSQSLQSAMLFAEDFNGRVKVVDNHRISVTQHMSVLRAKKLADEGKSAAEIKKILTDEAFESAIYITCDDLQHLKRGGRLTPSVAAIGTLLNIKPVLKIMGYKLDTYAKTRGMKAARKTMIKAALDRSTNELKYLADEGRLQILAAYTRVSDEVLSDWIAEIQEAFPGADIIADPLTLSIATHIGPGALAVALCEKP